MTRLSYTSLVGGICIVDETVSKDYISRLPYEILLAIVNLVIDQLPSRSAIIPLISRQFYQVATPVLYRHLHLSACPFDSCAVSTMILHRTLQKNEDLRAHIRHIDISVFDMVDHDMGTYPIIWEILSWLTEVTHLYVIRLGRDSNDAGTILQFALSNLPQLKSLSLYGKYQEFSLKQCIIEMKDRVSNLRGLTELSIQITSSFPKWDAVDLLPIKYHRTAQFTSLYIGKWSGGILALEQLLCWPKVLRHFTLGMVAYEAVSLGEIGRMLSYYKATLESIRITDTLGNSGYKEDMIDFTEFKALNSLSLLRWHFSNDADGTIFHRDTAKKLLAPNLARFTLGFGTQDNHFETWRDFQQREADWIREFARLAAERGASLSVIEVQFSPRRRSSGRSNLLYPWNLMCQVGKEIAKYNIELQYAPSLLESGGRYAWIRQESLSYDDDPYYEEDAYYYDDDRSPCDQYSRTSSTTTESSNIESSESESDGGVSEDL